MAKKTPKATKTAKRATTARRARPRKAQVSSLSLGRVSEAIASLEADIRMSRSVSPFARKRTLTMLGALDTLVRSFCMSDGGEVDYLVGSSE